MDDIQQYIDALAENTALASNIERAASYAADVLEDARELLYSFDDEYADEALSEVAEALSSLASVQSSWMPAYRGDAAELAARLGS